MASLVEARRDGRLVGREASSLDRHLLACSECRALDRRLEELRTLLREPTGAPTTPLEHQRSRLALLRAAAGPATAAPATGWRAHVPRMAAACGLLMLAAGIAAGISHMKHAGVPTARRVLADRASALAGSLRLSRPRTETVVVASEGARFERTTVDRAERVSLADGTLEFAVRKLAEGERFLVATDDAEVEVRGTVFLVEAHGGRVARVDVSEGKVEVRHRGGVSIIAAGGAWQPPLEDAGQEGGRRAAAVLLAREERSVPAGGWSARREESAVRSHGMLLASARPADGGRPASFDPRSFGMDASPSSPRADEAASRDFGQAVDILGKGDYAAARARLDAFRAAHPADDRADLAAFLAIVSLQRAGRKAEAQEAARRYLELYPNGDRRAEAERVAGVH